MRASAPLGLVTGVFDRLDMEPQKKRKRLTLDEKAAIIRAVTSGQKKCDVAAAHGIPASTLSTILKGKDDILRATSSGNLAHKKALKTTPHGKVEEALFAWFTDVRAKNIPVSGDLLQQKARSFACLLGDDEFKASPGWLSRFKERYSIVGKVLSGEASCVNMAVVGDWLSENVLDILGKYTPSDVYNADESGLFYQMLPKKTLALKGQTCHGGKHSKQRLTLLLCVNMDGSDKRDPLVIGKSARPRCFKGTKRLPVKYVANSKAWMSRAIFTTWLEEFDSDMRRQKRNVCLLLDNCTAHYVPAVELTNVELRYFPPNATSVVQPLDQGIINSVKCAYKRRVVERVLLNLDLKRDTKIDVFMAVEMVAAAWRATRQSVIVNCFRNSGFGTPGRETAEAAPDCAGAVHQHEDAWERLRLADEVPTGMSFSDYVNADANAVTTEVLDDGDILRLVGSVEGVAADDVDDDSEVTEAPVPTPGQVMDAIDLLRQFAGAHEGTEDALDALQAYEKSVRPLLTKRTQAKITDFLAGK